MWTQTGGRDSVAAQTTGRGMTAAEPPTRQDCTGDCGVQATGLQYSDKGTAQGVADWCATHGGYTAVQVQVARKNNPKNNRR